MASLGKTPKKAGGKFYTVATSTPSKSEAKTMKSESSQSHGGHLQRTPVRGGALFHHASPGFHEDEQPVCQDTSSTIKVFVRVRPTVESDHSRGGDSVVTVPTTDTVLLHGSEPKPFTFDYAADPTTTQQEMFNMIGKPFTDSCLAGYNSSIFAYGQTGSGKTYTMQGPDLSNPAGSDVEQRGLIPRTLEYLFDRIAQKQAVADSVKPGSLQFTVRCSYMEIYNETVTDLLDPSKVNLAVRENQKEGIYVDGITWQNVRTAEETAALLQRGVRNRHVAETSMNKESSRSHSLFTLKVESTLQTPEGLTKERHSCLNLVDLAGSERQKSTNATGGRLKEASNINKSLSALGNVIMALADISDGKARHVHYRDSKLTFLLKDSLGGNSKTAIIANVTGSDVNFGETLSTLKFAQRAKLIKTRAILNEDTNGSVEQLRVEIRRLKDELTLARSSNASGNPPTLARIDSEPYTSSTVSSPPRSSTESVEKLPPSEAARELQARIRDLENLLYQCLERQTESEEKLAAVSEVAEQAQSVLRPLHAEENELFKSYKMQLKLKAEMVSFLTAKIRTLEAASGEQPEGSQVDELQRQVALLEAENEALVRAQAAPLAWHPEYRRVALENAEMVLLLQQCRDADLESLKHVDHVNRELRDQFTTAIRDKAALHTQLLSLQAAAAAAPADEQPRLAAMTSPERKQFDSLALAKWKEQEAFDQQLQALQDRLDILARENSALVAQAEAADRRAKVAAGEVAELKPALKRLSSGDSTELEELSLRSKQLCETRASLELEAEGRRVSVEAMEKAQERVVLLEAELRATTDELQRSEKREATLRHQLQAAEYATQALERRVNRASAGAELGRLGKLQEDNESLQLRLDKLQDEYDSHKEEFAFMQSKLQRLQAELEAQERTAGDRSAQLEEARAEAGELQARIEQLQQIATAEQGEQAYRQKLEGAMAESRAELTEARRMLGESARREAELRDGLAHQQAVHEALQQETAIGQEVLRDTLKNLEGKGAALEQLQAELNDKTSEAKDLGEQLEAAQASQERADSTLAETKRRHEALIQDREGLEAAHQGQLSEMMGELKKRQERIRALEAEVSTTRDSFSKAQNRLSTLEGQVEESTRLGGEVQELQRQLEAKDGELFESNFDVQSLRSKLKLLETEREELEASREELAHGKQELQALVDKLSEQARQLASAHDRAEQLAAAAEALAGRVKELEEERETLLSQIEGMAKEVASSAERATEAEQRAKHAVEGTGVKDACSKLAEQQRENGELKHQMKQWLDEMKKLKAQEDAARQETAELGEEAVLLRKEKETAHLALVDAERLLAEVRAENARLVGHQNAKQKVQHTVKIKEENNALKSQLQASTSELTKSKERSGRLEQEVTKLRSALGVEGGAAQVLAEEEKAREELSAREGEIARLRQELDSVIETARAVVATTSAQAVGGEGVGGTALEAMEAVRSAMAEHSKLLEAKEGELRHREFQNGLLKKELQLHGKAHAADEENRHPNSPMRAHQSPALPKTPKTPLRALQA